MHQRSYTSEIYVIDADGSNLVRLTNNDVNETTPQFGHHNQMNDRQVGVSHDHTNKPSIKSTRVIVLGIDQRAYDISICASRGKGTVKSFFRLDWSTGSGRRGNTVKIARDDVHKVLGTYKKTITPAAETVKKWGNNQRNYPPRQFALQNA